MTKNRKDHQASASALLSKTSRIVLVVALFGVIALPSYGNAVKFGTVDTTHTFVGALIVPGFQFPIFCSGYLASPMVFLTGAHCPYLIQAWGFSIDNVFITFATDAKDTTSWIPVTKFIVNPGFQINPATIPTRDYAAAILAERVTEIAPALIASAGYLDSQFAEGKLTQATFGAVGYGMDQNFQVDGFRKAGTTTFNGLTQDWLITSGNVYTGNLGVCYGDSGGPALYNDGTRELVVGQVSWGDYVCQSLNVYARLDLPAAQDFISSVIAANP